eukprot:TRINITY_DN31_c0_g1_i1.p1 TRINITY_DN31_c0_g1~~TRINITY_DN31_c0_g1_i1.p1  ORF type:complete len:664 (+),score=142.40 TRINITY_DN31_c0_g1_i1:130-2121(+)
MAQQNQDNHDNTMRRQLSSNFPTTSEITSGLYRIFGIKTSGDHHVFSLDVLSRFQTASMISLAAIVIVYFLVYLDTVLIPFLMAVMLFYLLSPVMLFLTRKRREPVGKGKFFEIKHRIGKWFTLPHWMAVICCLLLVLGVVGCVGLIIYAALSTATDNMDDYEDRFHEIIEDLCGIGADMGIDMDSEEMIDKFESIDWTPLLVQGGEIMLSMLYYFFIIIVLLGYLLSGFNASKKKNGLMGQISEEVQRYMVVKVVISLCTGVCVTVALTILQCPLSALFGLLAFAFNFVPAVGSWIATLLPLPLILVERDLWPTRAILCILIPGAIQVSIGDIIEPMIFGKKMNMGAVTVLIALMFWGGCWGPAGMVMAIPLTSCVRIVISHVLQRAAGSTKREISRKKEKEEQEKQEEDKKWRERLATVESVRTLHCSGYEFDPDDDGGYDDDDGSTITSRSSRVRRQTSNPLNQQVVYFQQHSATTPTSGYRVANNLTRSCTNVEEANQPVSVLATPPSPKTIRMRARKRAGTIGALPESGQLPAVITIVEQRRLFRSNSSEIPRRPPSNSPPEPLTTKTTTTTTDLMKDLPLIQPTINLPIRRRTSFKSSNLEKDVEENSFGYDIPTTANSNSPKENDDERNDSIASLTTTTMRFIRPNTTKNTSSAQL